MTMLKGTYIYKSGKFVVYLEYRPRPKHRVSPFLILNYSNEKYKCSFS